MLYGMFQFNNCVQLGLVKVSWCKTLEHPGVLSQISVWEVPIEKMTTNSKFIFTEMILTFTFCLKFKNHFKFECEKKQYSDNSSVLRRTV